MILTSLFCLSIIMKLVVKALLCHVPDLHAFKCLTGKGFHHCQYVTYAHVSAKAHTEIKIRGTAQGKTGRILNEVLLVHMYHFWMTRRFKPQAPR